MSDERLKKLAQSAADGMICWHSLEDAMESAYELGKNDAAPVLCFRCEKLVEQEVEEAPAPQPPAQVDGFDVAHLRALADDIEADRPIGAQDLRAAADYIEAQGRELESAHIGIKVTEGISRQLRADLAAAREELVIARSIANRTGIALTAARARVTELERERDTALSSLAESVRVREALEAQRDGCMYSAQRYQGELYTATERVRALERALQATFDALIDAGMEDSCSVAVEQARTLLADATPAAPVPPSTTGCSHCNVAIGQVHVYGCPDDGDLFGGEPTAPVAVQGAGRALEVVGRRAIELLRTEGKALDAEARCKRDIAVRALLTAYDTVLKGDVRADIAAAAYARGAREMRARAEEVVADADILTVTQYHTYDDGAATLRAIAHSIRALPDTPEGEAGEAPNNQRG